MSKATPGPWQFTEPFELSPGDENVDVHVSGRNGGMIIARCCGPDMEANVRLIAAAPEMLEALKGASSVIQMFASGTMLHQEIEAAIAKAEGKQ